VLLWTRKGSAGMRRFAGADALRNHLPVSQRYPTPPSTDGSATRSRCPGTGYRSPCVHLERLSQALDCVAPDLGELDEDQHPMVVVRAESTPTLRVADQRRARDCGPDPGGLGRAS
jgi:hypothetical protein